MVNPFPRARRVGEMIRQELALLLRLKALDPRFTQVTITAVDLSPDLKNALIFVSLQQEEDKTSVLKALNKAQGFFRREIARAANLRVVPKLQFVYDESISRGSRLDYLLRSRPDSSEQGEE